MATSLDRIIAFFKRKQADTYEYSPLNEEASQIRLLTLLPGEFSSKIHVNLQIKQLTTERRPRYEALSYVWGSTENLVDIFVGKSTKYTLAVTQNLACALRYLRYQDRKRVLWIDAICVNQRDLQERSQQVKRMADIYTISNRVVVWLGEEGNNSTVALQTLERLNTKIEVSYPQRTMKPTSKQASESHWADGQAPLPFTEFEWSAINDLLGRTWFERLWVWQEIRLANRDAILICGYDSIEWERFRSAVYCINTKPFSHDLDGFAQRIYRAFELSDCRSYFKFIDIAEKTRFCKCTDAKDRVYALLSMIAVKENPRIEPDYTKSLQEIYQDLAIKDMKQSKDLRLLQSCKMLKSTQGMPTWVTDWSIPRSAMRLRYCRAAGITKADIGFPRDGILRVKGLQVATIHQIDVVRVQEGPSIEDIGKELRRLVSRFSVKDDRYEAFCRTICTNVFSDGFNPPLKYLPDSQKLITAFYEALISQPDSLATVSEYLKYHSNIIAEVLSGRSFFSTPEGHFGLAPVGAEENDLICIFLGCSSAMTLRATENNQFQVVGEAYCHGFMTGEALLGPLPGTFDMIFLFEEKVGGHFAAFIDRETGTIQVEDPRLATLPPGWRILHRTDESFQILVVNDDNGGERTTTHPRPNREASTERAVYLSDFELI